MRTAHGYVSAAVLDLQIAVDQGGQIAWADPAITWIELPDEIVIRKGRVFRSLVSIPYGRLQYIDVQSGPLMRSRGIASSTALV